MVQIPLYMSRKLTAFFLVFALLYTACAKKNDSPNSSADNTPYGFSMIVNGQYSTFNSYSTIDTTLNQIDYSGTGDSACCTGMQVAWGLSKFDGAATTKGIYPSSGFGLENQGEWTIYDYANWGYTPDIGFLAFPDSIIVTDITDSTITGTFSGTCIGELQNQNYPYNTIDSNMTVTNGKFHLRLH
jgi:hypothetical protein